MNIPERTHRASTDDNTLQSIYAYTCDPPRTPHDGRMYVCTQGVESLYTWNGKVEMDNELMLMAKTQTSLVEQVAKHVEDKHPYDVPEVIAVPVDNGSDAYLDWVVRETAT